MYLTARIPRRTLWIQLEFIYQQRCLHTNGVVLHSPDIARQARHPG